VLEDPHSLPGTDEIVARARDAHRSSSLGRRDTGQVQRRPASRAGRRGRAASAFSDADERRCLSAICDRALARDDSMLTMYLGKNGGSARHALRRVRTFAALLMK
jgi:hypothetical protein